VNRTPRARSGRRALSIAVHAAFVAALALATEPVWGPLLLGYSPTLDELLLIRCLRAF
jgi:hypothetical protein